MLAENNAHVATRVFAFYIFISWQNMSMKCFIDMNNVQAFEGATVRSHGPMLPNAFGDDVLNHYDPPRHTVSERLYVLIQKKAYQGSAGSFLASSCNDLEATETSCLCHSTARDHLL